MQGTGAALLAGVVGARHEAEQGEHLGDRDGGPDGDEVDGRTRGLGACFEVVVPGLAPLFAAFPGLGEFAIAFGKDGPSPLMGLTLGQEMGQVIHREPWIIQEQVLHFRADVFGKVISGPALVQQAFADAVEALVAEVIGAA